jgi:DNA-binding NtrC family response regulator/tetratricopeptide (TPR) repeat protein
MVRPGSPVSTGSPASSAPVSVRVSSLAELNSQIEAGRRAAADYRHDEALNIFDTVLASPLLNAELRVTVRCYLAESLENLARYREAVAALTEYEAPARRTGLHPVVLFQLWLRLGTGYGYTGDHPRSISYLKQALALAEERHDPEALGAAHLALGRVYRAIGETQFARDHLRIALQHHRMLGQWNSLAQNYFLIGNVCLNEGDFQGARENFEQAIKIIGEHRAPLLLGSIYTNLSNLILLREHGQAGEGVQIIEKAIFFLKQARNDRILAYAYNNLGYGLVHVGDWNRAEQVLQQAIDLGRNVEDHSVVAASMDTLGEVLMLRGEYDQAELLLRQAIEVAQSGNAPFTEEQLLQTLGRCLLARGRSEDARRSFESALRISEKISDQRSSASARLYLAEAYLNEEDERNAHRLLDEVSASIELTANVSLVARFRVLSGLVRARAGGFDAARHHLSQAITIFEMITDQYEESLAHYHLGNMLLTWGKASDHERGLAQLSQAQRICKQLGARPLLRRIEQALKGSADEIEELTLHLSPAVAPPRTIPEISGAEILRLIGASASRGLLLQELAILLHETLAGSTEQRFASVMIFSQDEAHGLMPVAVAGTEWEVTTDITEKISSIAGTASGTAEIEFSDGRVVRLRDGESGQVIVYLTLREVQDKLREVLEPLFRLAEICLELCALREQSRGLLHYDSAELRDEFTLPGLVYASRAMQRLAEDIYKIRGSRVTVMITGESGTGKELVASAIHKLSERRSAPFVPFNCTVAPREIIASQLFGHRKGAFTGAVADYHGVIRSADTGTLFLDEIGDLALEVQPQLLRFLQEGEIQPLGEARPVRVDVRVVAATNADIEKLVEEGRFREDLYYRLNVIRLRIPPLRERREEIPLLVDHFLRAYSSQSGLAETEQRITITPQALDLMMIYDWPGNIRQLANEVQRLMAYKPDGGAITERDLSPQIFDNISSRSLSLNPVSSSNSALMNAVTAGAQLIDLIWQPGVTSLGNLVDDLERRIITDAMHRHGGRREQVARELGITRKGLYLKLQRLRPDDEEKTD